MSKLIDYYTNLNTTQDLARMRFTTLLSNQFGYVPVYGPTMNDLQAAMRLFSHISGEYPGYKWVVEYRDTVITVVNETLAPDWGFKLKEHTLDSDGRVIKQYAGMLLEQFNMSQGKLQGDELAEKPRDLRGNVERLK